MSIISLISTSSFIVVNKTLCRNIGMEEAALIGLFCSLQEYHKGQFYKTHEVLSEETGLSVHKIKKAIKNLEDKKLIITKLQGIPCKKHYLIDEKELLIALNQKDDISLLTSSVKINQLDSENSSNYNKITKNNNTDKRDNKLSPAKKNSADDIPEDTSSEEEFKFGEEPEENRDPFYNWIIKVCTNARDNSLLAGSSQPFSIPRNDKAKYIKKIREYIRQLQCGSFIQVNKFTKTFLDNAPIGDEKRLLGISDDAAHAIVETAINNYLTARNNPDKYEFIGRDRKIDLGTFFYEFNENNGVLGVSHFLKYLDADLQEKNDISGKERMLSAIYEKDLSKMYSRVYNQYRDFSDEEMLRMVKSILSLCRWYKRNESRLIEIYRGKFKIRFPKGMETFIEHYLSRFIEKNRFEHAISLFPEKKHWKAFGDFIYEETDIDLESEMKTEKKKDSGVTITEIKRRMEAD